MSYTRAMLASEAENEFKPYGEKVSEGTTIIAAECDGGVVIGADSRTSVGSIVNNRVSDKLTEVTPYIYCLRSGSASDTQAITDIVKYHISIYEVEHGCLAPVHVAAQVFRDLCYRYRDSFSAGIIVAGWDPKFGGQVYSIPISGMITRKSLGIGGSGSIYVCGFLDKNYRTGMAQRECAELIKNALGLAMSRDGSSGGVIRMATINAKGVDRSLLLGDQVPQFKDH